MKPTKQRNGLAALVLALASAFAPSGCTMPGGPLFSGTNRTYSPTWEEAAEVTRRRAYSSAYDCGRFTIRDTKDGTICGWHEDGDIYLNGVKVIDGARGDSISIAVRRDGSIVINGIAVDYNAARAAARRANDERDHQNQ